VPILSVQVFEGGGGPITPPGKRLVKPLPSEFGLAVSERVF
jgi:hypothetical protein